MPEARWHRHTMAEPHEPVNRIRIRKACTRTKEVKKYFTHDILTPTLLPKKFNIFYGISYRSLICPGPHKQLRRGWNYTLNIGQTL